MGEYFESGKWNHIAEAPVGKDFYDYAVLYAAGDFYYFGGNADNNFRSILCLNSTTWTWSTIGHLNKAREGHGVILIEQTFMIIGGEGNYTTEACLLKNGNFTCEETDSTLTNYYRTPLLFPVNDKYTDNCTDPA